MSFTTEVGTSSFGSTHFWLVQEGTPARGLPRFAKQQVISEIHVPGGDRNIIQTLGNQTLPLTRTLLVQSEDLDTLIGQTGTTATLALLGDTPRTALLLSTSDPRQYPDGSAMVQATFRSLG